MGTAIPRLRNPWLNKLLKTQWLGLLSIVISLVTLYLTYFWKPDDLSVYFRFNDPNEVGTDQIHLNYIFSNAGKTPAFIEDVSLTEVFYQIDNNGRAIPNIDVCKDPSLPTPSFLALLPHDVHSQPFNANGRYAKFYTAKTIYLGSVQSPFSSLNIDAGAQRAIAAVYEMDAIDWNKFDVVLLCPVIRFFDLSGRPFTAICNGFQSDQFRIVKDGPKGVRTTPGGLARLLPTSVSNCRTAAY